MKLGDVVILMSEIMHSLNGKPPMSLGELAFLLQEEVPAVRSALFALVDEGAVQRHHLSDGTLRYSMSNPSAEPPSTATAPVPVEPPPSVLSFGVSLDIQVDSAIREIDAIASCDDVAARAAALYAVHRALDAHLERTAFAMIVSESTPRTVP